MTRQHTASAEWLFAEHLAKQRFLPFAAERGIDSLAGAYEVQREYLRLQVAARKVSRAGYKIGLTSTRMQAMCGIDSPVAGVVLQDRVHRSGIRLDPADYGRLGIEFEIAVRLGRDLVATDAPVSLAEAQQAVDAVAPAIELVDDRNCDYSTLDVLSLVADNAWNAGIVLGEFQSNWPDLADTQGRVVLGDGSVLDQGHGRDVLGNPLLAVAWLANHLGATGARLLAGEIVMTGSMVTTKFPTEPGPYRFEIAGLGSAELVLA